jgi:hypothetical protein
VRRVVSAGAANCFCDVALVRDLDGSRELGATTLPDIAAVPSQLGEEGGYA